MLSKILVYEAIYWWSYALVFLTLCRLFRLLKRGRVLPFLLVAGFLVLFVWMRFREPAQIEVEEKMIDIWVHKKVVLISDLHLWVYKDWVYLQKVVNKINSLWGIDYVFIAGDFTYNPTKHQNLDELFQPLADLKVPVYAVLGNHDEQKPWPDLKYDLVRALEKNGVQYLQNDVVKLDGFFLVGLGPHLAGEDDVFLLKNFHVLNKVVVLTHNPDTVLNYNNSNADLTLVGHTHCGQIRLPLIHDRLRPYYYPVEGDFDCGYMKTKYTKLYITPWLGEVIIPMRRRNPPKISVIDLGK